MQYKLQQLCNLDEEVRWDYTISKKIKKVWNVQLNLLQKLLEVCKEHNLRVFADSGTLLGAVRDGHFIPWDDDIDVVMPKEDIKKLEEIADSVFTAPFIFKPRYYSTLIMLPRLYFAGTSWFWTYLDYTNERSEIFIDILPLEGLPEDDKERFSVLLRAQHLSRFLFALSLNNRFTVSGWEKYKEGKKYLGSEAKLSRQQLYKKLDELSDKYKESNLVTSTFTLEKEASRQYILKKEWYEKAIYLNFESLSIPVPVNYHEVLTTYYGNYNIPIKKITPTTEEPTVIVIDPDHSIDFYKFQKYFQRFYFIKKFFCFYLYELNAKKLSLFISSMKLHLLLKKYKNKRVVLWGASNYLINHAANITFPNNVVAIVDLSEQLHGKKIGGVTVDSIDSIMCYKPEKIIITVVNNKFAVKKQIQENLKFKGIDLEVINI